jgi:hypothetical protein
MDFDVEAEARNSADSILLEWDGLVRCNSFLDLGEAREHSQPFAIAIERLLQDEYPESIVSARVDGFRRIILTKDPR